MMDELFSELNLQKCYMKNLRKRCVVGNDKIGRIKFENHLPSTMKLINTKILTSKYKFTSYKGVLIHKGINKVPRMIVMPTIRDKLVLMILKEYLAEQYQEVKIPLVQCIIQDIKKDINNFNSYVKIDIKDFYGSINQEILLKKLKGIDIRAEKLIKRCIENEIICYPFGKVRYVETGIPQGLPISNILAEIYLSEIDKNHKENKTYRYYRYVDDIFILCNEKNAARIKRNLKTELKEKLSLDINKDKSYHKSINEPTSYLGYKIENKKFNIQEGAIKKVEKSIEKLFREWKHNKTSYTKEMLVWDLNLKITGCKFEQGKYGWMFFYSQIDDMKILFHLDNLVEKLLKRYELEDLISHKRIKKFSRVYHEVIHNLNKTKYIPHFSRYSIDEQKQVLKDIFKEDIEKLSEEEVMYQFNLHIYKKTRELEEDIQTIS